jgi:hypothetical protein
LREGDDIPEADPDSSEVLIHTDKVAVLVKVSREQYATGSAATMLSEATRRALIRKANVAYLSHALPGRVLAGSSVPDTRKDSGGVAVFVSVLGRPTGLVFE